MTKEIKGQKKVHAATEADAGGSEVLREISIWIDNYDDLFSDFDPRPYSERNISDDFLIEIKKISNESEFLIEEIKLLIPEKERNAETENVIVKRLHSFYRKSSQNCSLRIRKQKRKGVIYTLIGGVAMSFASYFSYLKLEGPFMQIPIVILEPAGWFMVWTGLENLINSSRNRNSELDFYLKVVKSKITFVSI